jgi:hypothetical protein
MLIFGTGYLRTGAAAKDGVEHVPPEAITLPVPSDVAVWPLHEPRSRPFDGLAKLVDLQPPRPPLPIYAAKPCAECGTSHTTVLAFCPACQGVRDWKRARYERIGAEQGFGFSQRAFEAATGYSETGKEIVDIADFAISQPFSLR